MRGLAWLLPSLLLAACGSSHKDEGSGGGADGGAGGAGSGSDASGGGRVVGEGGLCEAFQVGSGLLRPRMLIVLDRSSSMRSAGVDRWTPSVDGIQAITADLDTRVDFGLMAFPGRGTGGQGGGGQSCAAGTIEVPIGAGTASQISSTLDDLRLVQSTPTAVSLAAAHEALKASVGDDIDVRTSGLYVVLVTDGAPNCTNGTIGGGGGLGGQDQAAVQATVAEVASLAADGIPTYVLGFGTQTDPVLKAALDAMAQAGGTGDTAHRPLEDEASVVAEFKSIAGGALTCELSLAEPPDDPKFVAVTLDGNLIGLDDANGWSLGADGTTITLKGSTCSAVKDTAARHQLAVEVRCTQVTLR